MQGGDDQDEGRDPFDGSEAHEGADAAREAGRVARRAQRKGEADPLEGLAARITTEGKPELAFDELVIAAALDLQADDAPAFQQLRRALKAAGVAVSQWDAALRDLQRRRKAESKAIERQRQLDAEVARRRTAAEEREAERARRAEERARATDAERAAHTEEGEFNGVTYRMEPGATSMETFDKWGDPEVTVLARFSSPIVADVLEFDSPDAKPRRTLALSVLFEGMTEAPPLALDLPVSALDRMTWPEQQFGSRGAVAPAKGAREHLRAAIQRCSRARERRRYRFTGRVRDGGQVLYLHAGGAIGPAGVASDVDVQPPDPADKFRLPPPPEGDELTRALAAAVAFFDMEPASVVVPLVGLVFRAPLGPSRLTVHVTGRKGLGKSLLAGLSQKFFGTETCNPACTDQFPAQWTDGSTAKGVSRTLATIGDMVVVVDDLRVSGQRDEAVFAMFDNVIRAHFNRAAPRKLTRDGGTRNDPPSRCSILSTGEVLPQGHSTRDRVVSLQLEERPAPDLDALTRARALLARGDEKGREEARAVSSLAPIVAHANDGTLAAAMSAFVQWTLTHDGGNLDRRERDAAKRWGLGDGDRAEGLLGALALGLESFFAFLAEHRALPEHELNARRQRALDAMRAVAGTHSKTVEAEDPAKLFCLALGDAVRMGNAHFARQLPTGDSGPPAKSPGVWGWRLKPRGENYEWEHQGPRIGRLAPDGNDVWLDPGPALEVAREHARRAGHPLPIDRESLGRALKAAELLGATDKDRGTLHILRRVGGGLKSKFYAVKIEALGLELEPEADDVPPPPPKTDDAPDASGFPVVEPALAELTDDDF